MAQEHLAPILRLGAPLPTSIGRCADLLHDVTELRLKMEKEAEEIAKRESEIKEYIIANLSTVGGDTGASGLKYRVQIVPKKVPILSTDINAFPNGGWGAFTSWIRKNDRFDFLQKRLSEKPIIEWQQEEKRLVPGIEMMTAKKISLTKI